MLTELLVRDNSLQVCIFALVGVPLPCQQESHLFQSHWVSAFCHKLANEVDVVHLLCNTQGLWVPLELPVNIECSFESMLHLFCVCCVVGA